MKIHADMIQGTPEWYAARCGLLTASTVNRILTSRLEFSDSDKMRGLLFELLAQSITGFVEPSFMSDHMMRGHADEIEARGLYSKHYAPVRQVGFITNDIMGFECGSSPDGLVGDGGMIEIKSCLHKIQMQRIIDGAVPNEFIPQMQFGMMVAEREWCDFISYSSGMPMQTIRVDADIQVQTKIASAVERFHEMLTTSAQIFAGRIKCENTRLVQTMRRELEIMV